MGLLSAAMERDWCAGGTPVRPMKRGGPWSDRNPSDVRVLPAAAWGRSCKNNMIQDMVSNGAHKVYL
jgi:hypothetical protein